MTDLPKSNWPKSNWPKSNRPRSSRLPEPFDARHPLIVFDGVCVLCSGFVRMVVRLDRQSRFRFARSPG